MTCGPCLRKANDGARGRGGSGGVETRRGAGGKRLERSPDAAAQANNAAVSCCVSPRVSPRLRKTEIGAHPDPGEAVDHLLDRGRVWEVEHERHYREAQNKGGGGASMNTSYFSFSVGSFHV